MRRIVTNLGTILWRVFLQDPRGLDKGDVLARLLRDIMKLAGSGLKLPCWDAVRKHLSPVWSAPTAARFLPANSRAVVVRVGCAVQVDKPDARRQSIA